MFNPRIQKNIFFDIIFESLDIRDNEYIKPDFSKLFELLLKQPSPARCGVKLCTIDAWQSAIFNFYCWFGLKL